MCFSVYLVKQILRFVDHSELAKLASINWGNSCWHRALQQDDVYINRFILIGDNHLRGHSKKGFSIPKWTMSMRDVYVYNSMYRAPRSAGATSVNHYYITTTHSINEWYDSRQGQLIIEGLGDAAVFLIDQTLVDGGDFTVRTTTVEVTNWSYPCYRINLYQCQVISKLSDERRGYINVGTAQQCRFTNLVIHSDDDLVLDDCHFSCSLILHSNKPLTITGCHFDRTSLHASITGEESIIFQRNTGTLKVKSFKTRNVGPFALTNPSDEWINVCLAMHRWLIGQHNGPNKLIDRINTMKSTYLKTSFSSKCHDDNIVLQRYHKEFEQLIAIYNSRYPDHHLDAAQEIETLIDDK